MPPKLKAKAPNAVKAKSPKTPLTTSQALRATIKAARDIMRKDKGLNGDLDRLPLLTWIMFLKFLDDLEIQREQEMKLAGKKFRAAVEPPYRWRDWASNPQGVTGDELLKFINDDECIRPDGKKGQGLFTYLRSLTSNNGDDRREVIATVFKGIDNRMKSGYLLRDVINRIASINFASSEDLHTLGTLYEVVLREMRDAAGDSGEFYTPRAVVRLMVAVTDPRLGEAVLDPASGTGGFLVEAYNHLATQVKTVADRKVLQEKTLFGCEPKPLPYLLCQMNLLLHGLHAPQIDPGNALRHKLTDIGERDRVDVILTNPPFGGEEERGIQGNFPEDTQTAETALLFLQLIMRKLRRQNGKARAAVVVPESVMSDKGVAARIRKEMIEEFNLHTIVRLPKGVFEPYSDIQTNLLFFDRSGKTATTWFYEHAVPESRQDMQNPCYTRSIPLRFDELVPIIDWWTNREQTKRAWQVSASAIAASGYSFDFRNPHTADFEVVSPEQILTRFDAPLQKATEILRNAKQGLERVQTLSPSTWPKRPLSDFLSLARTEAELRDEQSYKQITVRLYGKGASLRKTIVGGEIRTRPQFVAKAGQLIMSRIDARNGAFAIVPAELDGAVVSQDFPLFDVNLDVVEPVFLPVLLRSRGFLQACKRASRGTTNRKRLKEVLLLEELVPLPDRPVQELAADFVTSVESFNEQADLLKLAADESVFHFANFLFG